MACPELLANISGNAYSLWRFGPWVLASIAAFGRFYVDSSSQAETVSDEAWMQENVHVDTSSSDVESGCRR